MVCHAFGNVLIFALMWPTRVCCSGNALEGLGGLGGDWPQAKWGKVRKVNSCKLTFGSLHCCFDLCVGVLIFPLLRLTRGKVRKVNCCDSHFGQNQSSVGIADKFNFRWKRVLEIVNNITHNHTKEICHFVPPQKYGPFTFLYFLWSGPSAYMPIFLPILKNYLIDLKTFLPIFQSIQYISVEIIGISWKKTLFCMFAKNIHQFIFQSGAEVGE